MLFHFVTQMILCTAHNPQSKATLIGRDGLQEKILRGGEPQVSKDATGETAKASSGLQTHLTPAVSESQRFCFGRPAGLTWSDLLKNIRRLNNSRKSAKLLSDFYVLV